MLPAAGNAGRPKKYTAFLKYSRPFDLADMAEYVKLGSNQPWDSNIQTIFIVLNAFLNAKVRTQYLSFGKKAIFPEPSQKNKTFLLGGIELKKGFWQTIRPGWSK